MFLLKENIREINSLKKPKRGFPIKRFRSGLRMLIQIILLHGFHVGISIVRLNRYVIKYYNQRYDIKVEYL